MTRDELFAEIEICYADDFACVGTHYDGCWRVHPFCALRLIMDLVSADGVELPEADDVGDPHQVLLDALLETGASEETLQIARTVIATRQKT